MYRRYELFKDLAPVFDKELVICNLGFPSQELYEIRDRAENFYMLGSMGLSSSIGLGLSLQTSKKVVSIDGDGSVLMNLSTLSSIARFAPANYILLIVDNGSYGSTGDQPTHTSKGTSLAAIAKAAGVESSIEVDGKEAATSIRSTTSRRRIRLCPFAPNEPF